MLLTMKLSPADLRDAREVAAPHQVIEQVVVLDHASRTAVVGNPFKQERLAAFDLPELHASEPNAARRIGPVLMPLAKGFRVTRRRALCHPLAQAMASTTAV